MCSCCHGCGNRQFSSAQALVGAGHFLGDELIEAMLEYFGGDAQGAGNCALASRSMGLHHRPVEAEERRSAIGFRVHSFPDRAKGVLRQQRAELAAEVGFQLAPEHGENTHGKTLTCFQHDISYEAVAYYDINAALE